VVGKLHSSNVPDSQNPDTFFEIGRSGQAVVDR